MRTYLFLAGFPEIQGIVMHGRNMKNMVVICYWVVIFRSFAFIYQTIFT